MIEMKNSWVYSCSGLDSIPGFGHTNCFGSGAGYFSGFCPTFVYSIGARAVFANNWSYLQH